jgi:hypothetical protein
LQFAVTLNSLKPPPFQGFPMLARDTSPTICDSGVTSSGNGVRPNVDADGSVVGSHEFRVSETLCGALDRNTRSGGIDARGPRCGRVRMRRTSQHNARGSAFEFSRSETRSLDSSGRSVPRALGKDERP